MIRRLCSWFPTICLAFVLGFSNSETAQAVDDLLPDIIVRESDLYNNDVVTNISPGRTHLRFSNTTANVGLGRLHLIGTSPQGDSILVLQRVFRDDGTFWDDTAGYFIYHPTHSHVHFEDWCIYRLREILPGDSVGAIVAEGAKTSFCILDLGIYNSSLPNFNSSPYYTECGNGVQGLSVGWMDLYSKSLPGQNIDITDVPDGEYWLESEADPDNNVIESDDSNNIARIKIALGGGSSIAIDPYEPNDSIPQTVLRPEGAVNSPNLGPTGPRKVLTGLTVHLPGNGDFYRFYSAGTGTSADTVRIDFNNAVGDIDMRLRDSTGTQLAISESSLDREIILLTGRPPGWYYIQVYGYQNATNPSYTMTINPPQNTAPAVTVIDPPAGVTQRAHGFQNYTTTWNASDTDGDPTWITVYVNTTQSLNGLQTLIEASINTPGEDGYHIINSASVPPGTYWVYCQVTDGGQVSGDWSDGQIEFLTSFDTDGDGLYDYEDNCIGWANPAQDSGCVNHGDPQADGIVNIFDVVKLVDIAFRANPAIIDADCPHDPAGRTDLNCDGATTIIDVTMMIDVAFRGVELNFCDPCACPSYPSSCP